MSKDTYDKIKDELINTLLLILSFVSIPALAFSISRFFHIGWQPAFLIQLILAILLILFAFYRKSISLYIKAGLLVFISLVVSVIAFFNFALSGSGFPFLLISVLIAVVFLGVKKTLWIFMLYVLTTLIIGLLFIKGIVVPKINTAGYYTHFTSWLSALVSFSIITGLTIIILGNIGQLLASKLTEVEKANNELKRALEEINTLRGILPICSHCKKIRDDEGYWKQIEAYFQDHTEVKFSHGVCRECAKKYYPDMDLYDD